jgi:hypothetical protein
MMIEQSDIVEICSGDSYSSVTIKIRYREAEAILNKIGISEAGGGFYCNSNGDDMAYVMDRKTEFYSR